MLHGNSGVHSSLLNLTPRSGIQRLDGRFKQGKRACRFLHVEQPLLFFCLRQLEGPQQLTEGQAVSSCLALEDFLTRTESQSRCVWQQRHLQDSPQPLLCLPLLVFAKSSRQNAAWQQSQMVMPLVESSLPAAKLAVSET